MLTFIIITGGCVFYCAFALLVCKSMAFGMGSKEQHAAEFQAFLQAYDDAIYRAQQKHQPTRALVQAKSDYVHQMLRSGL